MIKCMCSLWKIRSTLIHLVFYVLWKGCMYINKFLYNTTHFTLILHLIEMLYATTHPLHICASIPQVILNWMLWLLFTDEALNKYWIFTLPKYEVGRIQISWENQIYISSLNDEKTFLKKCTFVECKKGGAQAAVSCVGINNLNAFFEIKC